MLTWHWSWTDKEVPVAGGDGDGDGDENDNDKGGATKPMAQRMYLINKKLVLIIRSMKMVVMQVTAYSALFLSVGYVTGSLSESWSALVSYYTHEARRRAPLQSIIRRFRLAGFGSTYNIHIKEFSAYCFTLPLNFLTQIEWKTIRNLTSRYDVGTSEILLPE